MLITPLAKGVSKSGDGYLFPSVLLDDATGNQTAWSFIYEVNKAAGNDTGILINMTDTASPGTSLLIDAQVGGVSKFRVDTTGTGTFAGGLNVGAGTIQPISNNVTLSLNTTKTFSAANNAIKMLGGAVSNTTGQFNGVAILPTYNQTSGDASNTDLLINRTETSVGSGLQRLLQLKTGGVTKFEVDNLGHTNVYGILSVAGVVGVLGNNNTLTLGYGNSHNSAGDHIRMMLSESNTATTGQVNAINITPTYNQTSGTASNTDLLINRTETAIGSGSQLLIDAKVDDASKFNVDNTGSIVTTGTISSGPLSVNDKSSMTAIGGFAIKLTNKTGTTTVAGQLVQADTTTDFAFATAASAADDVVGIVLDAGVGDGSEAWVVVSGMADVLVDSGGCTRGDRLIASTTSGSAEVWNTGGAVATHFLEIGHCIETVVGTGLARCILHFN